MAISKDWFDVVSLIKAKAHLRIEHEFENEYIEDLILDAVDFSMRSASLSFEDLDLEIEIPRPLIRASLLLIGDWYSNRMEDSEMRKTKIHFGFEKLIQQIAPIKIY